MSHNSDNPTGYGLAFQELLDEIEVKKKSLAELCQRAQVLMFKEREQERIRDRWYIHNNQYKYPKRSVK